LIFCNFNRRYSSLSRIIKDNLNKNIPKRILIDVNSPGYGDETSWISDEEISGGPIIGESCHFIDLAKYFVDRPVSSYDIKCNKASKDYCLSTAIYYALRCTFELKIQA
jgi:predicted dehydrogenase